MATGKGLIRSLNRQAASSGRTKPIEARTGRLTEPRACERCGAVFARRIWQRPAKVSHALLGRATWTVCPACRQASREEYCGRIRLQGAFAFANQKEIRRRIENVAARASHTQPERRIVSIERDGEVIEVLTTSQKLAHRIVNELKKTFRGRASYSWSDDGSLFAIWERDDIPQTARRSPAAASKKRGAEQRPTK
jgi:NMD protein affecting ribosome stability and mRNA decay